MTDEDLLEAAKKSRMQSYSPYSHFAVGAAALANGKVYGGCNIENASYPVGICAERVAMAKAVADGAREIEALAVVADTPAPCTPCGMCRQMMAEFHVHRIILGNMGGAKQVLRMEELLPGAFAGEDLCR